MSGGTVAGEGMQPIAHGTGFELYRRGRSASGFKDHSDSSIEAVPRARRALESSRVASGSRRSNQASRPDSAPVERDRDAAQLRASVPRIEL